MTIKASGNDIGLKSEEEHPASAGSGLSVFAFSFILIVVTIALSATVYYHITTVRERELFRRQARKNIRVVTHAVRTQIATHLIAGDYKRINDIMVNAFGFNARVEEAMIVSAAGGEIYYDMAGWREREPFRDSMLRDDLEWFSTDINQLSGMVIIGEEEVNVGRLYIGYSANSPIMSNLQDEVMDYCKMLLVEVNDKLERNEVGETAFIMAHMMANNRNVKNAWLINNDWMVYDALLTAENGKIVRGETGYKTDGKNIAMAKKVSATKLIGMEMKEKSGGGYIYEIFMPMLRRGHRIGTIMMHYDVSDFMKEQKESRVLLYAAIALFGLVATAGALFTSLWISRPVRKLAEAARSAGAGEMDQEVSVGLAGREIQSLAVDFNQMIQHRRDAETNLQKSERQLRELSRRVISAQEEERSRIAGELHDEFGHRIVALSLKLAAIRKKSLLPEDEVESLSSLMRETSTEVMRIVKGLSPSVIEKLGLSSAVDDLIDSIQAQRDVRIECDIDNIDRGAIPLKNAINIYRIIQEAFNNIYKHSDADTVRLKLKNTADAVSLEITDNGRGMALDWTNLGGGIGLLDIRERAFDMGAKIDIQSSPGRGTALRLSVPHHTGNPEESE